MDHFLYRDGALYAEDVPVAEIAAAVGTPFYVYSSATLLRHFKLFDEALEGTDHLICYAMKAASNQAILKTLAQAGAGMDVVSVGEYLRAKAAGVPGDRIVFSGVGKTADEIRTALSGGIRQFNVESEPEMEVLSAVAQELGTIAQNKLPVKIIILNNFIQVFLREAKVGQLFLYGADSMQACGERLVCDALLFLKPLLEFFFTHLCHPPSISIYFG